VRKLIEYTLVSADGVFENPQSWGAITFRDDAYLRDGLGQLLACDAMLMGRRTYEISAKIWPSRTDPWATRLNAIQKYVFSSKLEKAEWKNSTVIRGDVVAEVRKLKQQDGRDLLMWGHGLLDPSRRGSAGQAIFSGGRKRPIEACCDKKLLENREAHI
jgi:dihydrofolate reductase